MSFAINSLASFKRGQYFLVYRSISTFFLFILQMFYFAMNIKICPSFKQDSCSLAPVLTSHILLKSCKQKL